MTATDAPSKDFLQVDDFLVGLLESQALRLAIDTGIITHLEERATATSRELASLLGDGPVRIDLLAAVLGAAGVLEGGGDDVRLSAAFRQVLAYRELLEAKLDFGLLAAHDFQSGFGDFIADPNRFSPTSATYDLYSYRAARFTDPASEAVTARWVRYVTALSRYEAPFLLSAHDFSPHRSLLEIGGNSGEVARQLCERHAHLSVTVADLPGVCALGRRHLASSSAADQVSFRDLDVFEPMLDELDLGVHDAVLFKSVLHDWPDPAAADLLRRADRGLRPGGELVIFERAPLRFTRSPIRVADWGLVICAPAFRGPDLYVEVLGGLGYQSVEVRPVEIDFDFFVLSARKPAS